ncbi:MAG: hypothetical protein AAGA53_12155 [Pseudomonadota bacterium]
MSKMAGARSIVVDEDHLRTPEIHRTAEAKSTSNLKDVMAAADRQLAISQELRLLDATGDLEDAIAQEITQEFAKQEKKMTPVAEKPVEVSFSDSQSQRILELHRRQQTVSDTKSQIESGAQLLKILIQRSEQMSEYLEKAEIEITELETIESKYATLRKASEKLANEFRELSSKNAENQKRVSLLEEQQKLDREEHSKTLKELNKVNEVKSSQAADIKKNKGIIAKLRDANLDLEERYKVSISETSECKRKIDSLQQKLMQTELEVSEAKKSFANQKIHVDSLTKDNELLAIDLADIQARYEKLNAKYSEAKVTAEDFEYKLKSEIVNSEERVQLKEARILQLEKAVEVLTKEAAAMGYASEEALLTLSGDDLPKILCRKNKAKQSSTKAKAD